MDQEAPTKIKRRASDAKWRANIAHCYDSLKKIIPTPNDYPRKKIPKVLVLKECNQHLNFLEQTITFLLDVCDQSKSDLQKCVTLDSLKDEFACAEQHRKEKVKEGKTTCNKHLAFFNGSNISSCCDSEPSYQLPSPFLKSSGLQLLPEWMFHRMREDLQIELNDRMKRRRDVAIDSIIRYNSAAYPRTKIRKLTPFTEPIAKKEPDEPVNSSSGTALKTNSLTMPSADRPLNAAEAEIAARALDFETPAKQCSSMTEPEENRDLVITSTPNDNASVNRQSAFRIQAASPGFTPIPRLPRTPNSRSEFIAKVDESAHCSELMKGFDEISSKMPRTPKRRRLNIEPSRRVRRRLLLTTYDSPTKVKEPVELRKEHPKCRIRLDRLYPEEQMKTKSSCETLVSPCKHVDNVISSSSISGYAAFHRQVSEQLRIYLPPEKVNSESMNNTILEVWKQLPDDQRNAMVAMAMMGELNKSLSKDLDDIRLEPICDDDFVDVTARSNEIDADVLCAVNDLMNGTVPNLHDALPPQTDGQHTSPPKLNLSTPDFKNLDLSNINESLPWVSGFEMDLFKHMFDEKTLEASSPIALTLADADDWQLINPLDLSVPVNKRLSLNLPLHEE
ncbi:uncharacterized protein LOC141913169 [Tubulanus polymorphus]|uniref:uncharacterized protein LOC141913169 n=1 Tax=Tubulanus polymorphus TaxID=672921 RepID=UPI003DA41D9A